MATRMLFLCSCGETFDIDNYAGMDAHLEANPDHTASEEYVHASVVAFKPRSAVMSVDIISGGSDD